MEYRFFRKPLSSDWVTPFNSAQPMNGKMATLSQDVFRMLNNCSLDITRTERVEILESFCSRLRFNGYPPRTAARILRNDILNFEISGSE